MRADGRAGGYDEANLARVASRRTRLEIESGDVCRTKKMLRYEVWSSGLRVCKGAELFWTDSRYTMHDFFVFGRLLTYLLTYSMEQGPS